jgi:SpoVK/Ycf46/Vps4 family AAA+-type ATPase
VGKKVKSKINININKDDSELNDFLYCWGEFNSRPNKILIYNTYLRESFSSVINEYSVGKNRFTEVIPSTESLIINDKILEKINDGLYISYLVLDRVNENSVIHDIVFFFKDDEQLELVNNLIEQLDNCIFDLETNYSDAKFNTVSITQNGIDLEAAELSELDEEVDYYYDRQTLKSVDKLIKIIKKSNKGLSLMYGPRGTGKTSIINYLSQKLSKMIIFIPNNMIDTTVNNPEFKTFIKKHPDSVLVIDDCEVIFNQLFNKSNTFVNNLLQLVDGPLSNSLNLNIIMLFNLDDENEIDQSLLDCNNLLDIIEFGLLDEDSSNELAKHISSRKKYKNKTKLIDIIKKRTPIENKKIGL